MGIERGPLGAGELVCSEWNGSPVPDVQVSPDTLGDQASPDEGVWELSDAAASDRSSPLTDDGDILHLTEEDARRSGAQVWRIMRRARDSQ